MKTPRCLVVAGDEGKRRYLAFLVEQLGFDAVPIARTAQSYYHRRDPPDAMIVVEGNLLDGPAVRIADSWPHHTKPLTLIVPAARDITREYVRLSLEELAVHAYEFARSCEDRQLVFNFDALEVEPPYLMAAE